MDKEPHLTKIQKLQNEVADLKTKVQALETNRAAIIDAHIAQAMSKLQGVSGIKVVYPTISGESLANQLKQIGQIISTNDHIWLSVDGIPTRFATVLIPA